MFKKPLIEQVNTNSQKLALSELKIGMYVLSVLAKNKDVSIKSEGYISKQSQITRLQSLDITHVVIDPTKTKIAEKSVNVVELETVDDFENTEKKHEQAHKASLDGELLKAQKLYTNAKDLQKKLIESISNKQPISIETVKENTNEFINSIFRNQDALLCMLQLRIKDDYLMEHSLNVSILMGIFCKHLKIERSITEELVLGAFLHDLGKVLIPDHILHKPGKLSEEEYDIMKQHVNFGVKLLKSLSNIPDLALSMVQDHHERLNGTGYPNQLSGEQLSQYSRMIAIVDCYDAMTAERIYKSGMQPIQAFKILTKEASNSYDAELVEQFIQCLGLYPVGTLVKLKSGKLAFVSQVNLQKPLTPCVRVFYSIKHKQAIAIQELDLSKSKYNDEIESCVQPHEFNLNILSFFKEAFL